MEEEILKVIKERGLLLEKSVLELLGNFKDQGIAKDFLVNIEKISGQKMITMNLIGKNIEFVNSVVKKLPGEEKSMIENTFIRLGFSLEVRKERKVVEGDVKGGERPDYKVF